MRYFLRFLMGLIFSSTLLADQLLGLPPITIPNDNLQTPEKIALGRLLFHDNRLSADGTISCASCHQSEKAFTDGLPLAQGSQAQLGNRNVPTVINSAFFETLFLDGRANSLEDQALGPFTNPIEHGLDSHQRIVDTLQADPYYSAQFNRAFGIEAKDITIRHVVKAIAVYERTLIVGNSAFDRYLFGRDHTTLSESAERGLDLFKRKGNCVTCHEISWNNALFTDNRFYNIGVGSYKLTPVLDGLMAALNQGKNPDDYPLTPQQRTELARFNITKVPSDIGRYKTPTLRNIALTAPYMHDGSIKDLKSVIEYYNKGGDKNRFIDTKIFPLHLSPQEKVDLLAFMQALTSAQLPK